MTEFLTLAVLGASTVLPSKVPYEVVTFVPTIVIADGTTVALSDDKQAVRNNVSPKQSTRNNKRDADLIEMDETRLPKSMRYPFSPSIIRQIEQGSILTLTYTRSKIPAAPMPVPTHIVTMPYFNC